MARLTCPPGYWAAEAVGCKCDADVPLAECLHVDLHKYAARHLYHGAPPWLTEGQCISSMSKCGRWDFGGCGGVVWVWFSGHTRHQMGTSIGPVQLATTKLFVQPGASLPRAQK